jgi:hypothetical protein
MELEMSSALIPVLFPRESEVISPVSRQQRDLGFFQLVQMFPPVPGGEGRAEGELSISLQRYGFALLT